MECEKVGRIKINHLEPTDSKSTASHAWYCSAKRATRYRYNNVTGGERPVGAHQSLEQDTSHLLSFRQGASHELPFLSSHHAPSQTLLWCCRSCSQNGFCQG